MNEFNSQEYANDQIAKANEVKQLDNTTWQAPGSEHALAWLRCFLYLPSCVAREKEAEGGRTCEFSQKVMLRGQGNKNWLPVPGLLRLEPDEKSFEGKATMIFSKVVEDLFTNVAHAAGEAWPPFNVQSGYAAALNYGMKTTLLDWTVNPSVAIDMATNTIKESKDQSAVVY